MKIVKFADLDKIFVIVLIVLFGACRPTGKAKEDNRLEDKFLVELQAKVPMDDEFELFYRGRDEKFSAERSITVKVKGMEEFQMVTFVFDTLEFPSYIRIDFGKNKAQKEMVFGHLAFRYNDNVHMFSKEEITKYFRTNPGLDIDFNNSKVRTQEIDGKYDPYLSSFDIAYFINKVMLF